VSRVLVWVLAWLVYLHGGKLVLLPMVTVDVDNIKLDNDVMTTLNSSLIYNWKHGKNMNFVILRPLHENDGYVFTAESMG